MKKLIFLLCFLLFTPLFSEDTSEYLENVKFDPEHGALNYDGKLKILYDLPKNDLVKKVYLSVVIGSNEIVIDSTVEDSDFGYLNNSLTLYGADLYEIIDAEKSHGFVRENSVDVAAADSDITPDEDVAADEDISDEDVMSDDAADLEQDDSDSDYVESNKAWADGTYKIKLIVELDSSTTGSDDEKDDSDTETTTTTTVPANVSQTLTVRFDNTAPAAPEFPDADADIASTEGGDQRIIIRVIPPVDPDDSKKYEKIGKYHVKLEGWFDNDGTETLTELEYTTEVSSSSYDEVWEFSVSGKDGFEIINNDKNIDKYRYNITIYAEDIAGNSNPDNFVETTGSAITTYGFWSNYEKSGGKDDGKFCFVATAGFGSYFHPNVMILRDFRDKVLSRFGPGRDFIKTYYKFGRIPAGIINEYSVLKPVSRTMLMPLVVLAWFLTTTLGNIILGIWMLMVAMFFFKLKMNRKVLMPLILFGIFTYSANLYGVDGEFSFNNSFYYPGDIDDGGVPGKPFKAIGGSKLRYLPSLTFGFAMPVLKDYIRWSFIGGIGYTRFKGTAIKADGEKSSDSTEMHFIPLMAEMKLRPVYWFPVWPYATIGIDYYTWWIREKGKTAEDGGTFGFHGNFGLLVSLNWIDEDSSRKFEESAGITNTGLFIQYRLEKINDFNKKESFDLTGSRFEFGILFEF